MAAAPARIPPRAPSPGTGRELWLFRHGEVAPEWQGRVYGGLDVPLSRSGRRESRAVARRFRGIPFARVLSSDLDRARTLARLLSAASGAPLELSPGLREIERGRWAGRTVAEVQREAPQEVAAFFARSWSYTGHGGESDAALWERSWPPIEAALAARESGPLAVVAHYNVLRVVLARMLGVAPKDSFGLRVDLARAVLARDAPDGWQLVRSNVRGPKR